MVALWYILVGVVGLIIGAVIGIVVAKKSIKKQLQKHPPIDEGMIRYIYSQVGRKPSESDLKRIMNQMKNSQH
jgi:uncharacterized protein YneF (UPF0154 family)